MRKDSICPVCGMTVADKLIQAEHLGIHYYFCSEQCRTNFLSHPRLYSGAAPEPKEREEILKLRKFRLARPLSDAESEAIDRKLEQLMGIKEFDVQERIIKITYDLWQCRAEQVEACFRAAGVRLSTSWSHRLRLGWMHYSEENELDNLNAQPGACCNRPPRKG